MRRTCLALAAVTALFTALGGFYALAGTKSISSVSIKVTSKLEAGTKLPDIELEDSPADGGVSVSASNTRYHVSEAEWVDKSSKELTVAEEPRMKVTLEPEDVGEAYFLASYKKSDVKVSGGSFVSAKRDGDDLVVTLRVSGVKGQYDPPEDAYWHEDNLGEARWEKPENTSGYYELRLNRNGKKVHTVDKTTALRYNFYPYMTEKGEYTFEVRTILETDLQKKYGKKSDWIESGELKITDRYVSDGKGKGGSDSTKKGTEEQVGWNKDEDGWTYRFPDGDLKRGGWEKIRDLWYYFDMDGRMQTGWQQVNGYYYFLYPDGRMATEWARIDGTWYYFRPEKEDKAPEGSMVSSGWRVIGAYYYYFNTDGSMYNGWLRKNSDWYYLNELDNSLMGAMFTGWFERNGKTYFTDSNGVMAQGWYRIDGNWYYFYPESGELARNRDIDGFYVNEDGIWR